MKDLLRNWDIAYSEITEIQEDVWKIDDIYFLKAATNEDWTRNFMLSMELRKAGIPAPEVVATRNGDTYLMQENKYYYLTRTLKGRHYSREEIIENPELAHLVGQVIAKLHWAFTEIPDEHRFEDADFVKELNGWIKSNLVEHASNSYTYSIFQDCVSKLESVYNNLKRHLIHRDMHLGNILFVGHEITGYIDFDITQINVRIFDIAYLLAGWIVNKVDDDAYMSKWRQTVKHVIEGYQEVQQLYEIELSSIVIMMCCIEILFVAYYSGMKDTENASLAEECLKWLWSNQELF